MASGPVKISGSFDPQMSSAQNLTASHVWKFLGKQKAYLIADTVGAGKSFISLAVAFGHWRKQRRKRQSLYKMLIIAPTTELSSSWMNKLCGEFRESKDRIGELAVSPNVGSFFDRYLDEFRSKVPPEIVVYQFRGKHDVHRMMDEVEGNVRFKKFRPRQSAAQSRIEILVATPGWLAKGRMGSTKRKGSFSWFWEEWLRSVDCIIADEIFGAKNQNTIYGSLLRPNLSNESHGSGRKSISKLWSVRGERPLLLGLSATLLSRDISDAWSLIEMTWAWKSKKYSFINPDPEFQPYGGIKNDLNEFQEALKNGLASNGKEALKVSRGVYNEKKKILESKLQQIIVRTQPAPRRSYSFWGAGGSVIHEAATIKSFPLKEGIQPIIDALSENASDEKSTSNLSQFLKLAIEKDKTFDAKTDLSVPASWTSITEHMDGIKSPKHDSLQAWVSDHYSLAEKGWLDKNKDSDFQFKLLVYVHHVKTARMLRHLKTDQGGFGIKLHKMLRLRMLQTCHSLAAMNKDIFERGVLEKPNREFRELLEDHHNISINLLKGPQYLTLLLAALVHANKAKNQTEKIENFFKTIDGNIVEKRRAPYIQVLSRYIEIRKAILGKIKATELLNFDYRKENKRRKLPSLSLEALNIENAPLSEEAKLNLLGQINSLTQEFYKKVGVGKRVRESREIKRIQDKFVEIISNAIIGSGEWAGKINGLKKSPERHAEKLRISHKFVNQRHRMPSEVEVLTGQEQGKRDFVTRKFLTPGNPFLLALTNICTVGVDLHQYCWDVVHYTPSWTPHEFEQKTGRIDRPRTEVDLRFDVAKDKNKIRVHHLIWPNTYDERILSRVHLRSQYSQRLLGNKSQDALEKIETRAGEFVELFAPLNLSPIKR